MRMLELGLCRLLAGFTPLKLAKLRGLFLLEKLMLFGLFGLLEVEFYGESDCSIYQTIFIVYKNSKQSDNFIDWLVGRFK